MKWQPTPDALEKAAQLLKEGKLISFPTETVYGLGALAENDVAVTEIFRRKGRPAKNPLICHFSHRNQFEDFVEIPADHKSFIETYWEKGVSFVLPLKKETLISSKVTAGGSTLAVRVPSHPLAKELLEKVGKPVSAPSANKSMKVSPTCAEDVDEAFPDIPVLDGGACTGGIESSVVDLTTPQPKILRPGLVFPEADPTSSSEELKSPGLLSKHYAPERPVFLNITEPRINQAHITFGPGKKTDLEAGLFNLSPSGDLQEAARNLYRALRDLDQPPFKAITICPLPQEGIGQALQDRLSRAASKVNT